MKQKIKTRCFSFLTALAIMIGAFAGATPAMAAEVNYDSTLDTDVVDTSEYTEEAQMLREKIDAIIAEENGATPYADYKTDYWGATRVVGKHTGGNHKIYGHQARMCIAFKPLDDNGALDASCATSFWSWTLHYNPWNVDDDGYCMYVGDWKNITYMGTYQMSYILSTTGSGGYDPNDIRIGHFHVWVDYK